MITFTRCAFMAKQACATFSQVVQKITPPIANNFLKFFFALFAILTLNAATAWGADVTVKWTASSGALGSKIGSGTIKTGTFSWDYTRTLKSGSTYTGWTSNCIQLGKNGGVENITFTTSAIPGTIKNVSIECASYQGKHNVAITVGGKSYLSSTATSSWTTVSAKSASGTSSGTIQISLTGGTRALYIKSISVTYEEAAATVPVTGVSLNKSTLTLTEGDSETLTATVAPANATDKTVTWSTSNANFATVSNGKVTAVAEGSATITVKTKDGNKTATCNVTVNPKPKYTVTWNVNGEVYETTQVTEGSLPTFPATPSSCDATSTTFYGWATATWDGKINDVSAKTIYTSANDMPAVNGAVTYYAVFAKETTKNGESSTVSLFSENFSSITSGNSTSTSGSSSAWTKNDNFYSVSAAYQAGGAVRLGTGSAIGSIVTKQLIAAVGETLTISFKVKGWSSVEGKIQVSGNNSEFAQPADITYTSTMSGSFETKNVSVVLTKANPYIKIATTAKRAFIDDIVITKNTQGAQTTTYSDYTTSCSQQLTPLDKPTGLEAKEITSNSAILSWDEVENNSSYKVTITDDHDYTETFTVMDEKKSVSGLSPSTTYNWTVKAIGDGTSYTDSEASQHTFTTTAASTPEPEPGTDDDCVWQLVTSASNLKVGDEIVVAAKDYNYALSTTQNNDNRGKANITKNQDQTITFGDDVQIITLEEGVSYSGTYVFYAGTGYLYAAGANSNNYLRTYNQKIANGDWEIEITNGTAIVTAQGSASRNILKYNNNSGIFSCYASDNSMQDIVLYKKVCAVAQTYSVKKGTLENCTLKFSKREDNFTNDELTGLAEKDYVYFTITPSSGYELKGEPVVKDASDNDVECVEADGVWMFEMPASDVTVTVSCVSKVVESNSTATIVFASNANQEDGSSSVITEQTEIDKVVAQGIEFVSGFADVSKVYPNSVHGLKLGTGSSIGKITIGLNISKKVSKITFKTYQYKEKEATIKFSAGGKEGSTSEFGDYTLTFDEPTTVSQIVISTGQASKGRAYVSQIDIELAEDEAGEGGEDPVVPTPTVNPTATFVFNTADGLAKLGIAYPTTPDGDSNSNKTNIGNNTTVISNGVGLTITSGTTATRVWLTASGVLDLRVYKGATLTFAVADGFEIIKVDFEGSDLTNLAVDDNPMTGTIWEGNQKSVTFENQSTVVKINTIAVTVAYTRNVTKDEYGTICIPYGSNNYTGAKFYEVSWLKEGVGLYLDELAANAELVAGKPYIFLATTSGEIEIICTGEAVINPIDGQAGLTGTFTKIQDLQTSDPSNTLEGNYMIADNKIWLCGTSCWLNANRAYIKDSKLPKTEQAKIPGRRRVCMGENTTTDFENITNGENNTIKVIENGQLIIIRNGEKYNIQGQKL